MGLWEIPLMDGIHGILCFGKTNRTHLFKGRSYC